MYQKVVTAVNCLACYIRHLIEFVINIVEQHNSAIAMFTNLVQSDSDSYHISCAAAVVKHNTGSYYRLHKSIMKSSPGDHAKLYVRSEQSGRLIMNLEEKETA